MFLYKSKMGMSKLSDKYFKSCWRSSDNKKLIKASTSCTIVSTVDAANLWSSLNLRSHKAACFLINSS